MKKAQSQGMIVRANKKIKIMGWVVNLRLFNM